jgi:hypothetical protein
LKLTETELLEIDRQYTPCDVINDHHINRISRSAR